MSIRETIQPTCFLYDNGSFRPEATFSLRNLAEKLSNRLGRVVRPVSLLHSTNIDPAKLNGIAAELLEPALNAFFEDNPIGEAILLPLFFGPSGAVTDYVPQRLESIQKRFPHARIKSASSLVKPDGNGARLIAQIIADRVTGMLRKDKPDTNCGVVLVDHGSPVEEVTQVRNQIARELGCLLHGQVEGVIAASMERREGEAYAFNEPLLERALQLDEIRNHHVIVALQFLSAGRHAGAGGDIEQICQSALREYSSGSIRITDPISDDDRLVDLLEIRARDVFGH